LSRNINIRIYKAVILPVVVIYVKLGLTLWVEHRLRMFENRVLRRIFGPKRDELTRGWKLQNEKLRNLYSSPGIIRAIKSRKMRCQGMKQKCGKEEQCI
jgi:hypothetical protein